MIFAGTNVVKNAGMIMVIFAIFVGFALLFTVTNKMEAATRNAVNQTNITINETLMPFTTHAQYVSLKSFLLTNFAFLVYFVVLLILFSSFVAATDIKTYVMLALGGTICTVILQFLASTLWSQFSLTGLIDFSDFDANSLWFISNIGYIFVINLLAGLASFVFARKAPQEGRLT